MLRGCVPYLSIASVAFPAGSVPLAAGPVSCSVIPISTANGATPSGPITASVSGAQRIE
jgi:hypothetical protein